MTTEELKEYYEVTREANEVSFEQWCVDHMTDFTISFYIEDDTQHIIDELTTSVNIKAIDEDDALEQAEVLYTQQDLPCYSVMEIED